jgi:hypothetical protein
VSTVSCRFFWANDGDQGFFHDFSIKTFYS